MMIRCEACGVLFREQRTLQRLQGALRKIRAVSRKRGVTLVSFLTLFNQKSSGKSQIDFPKFFSQITWVGVEVC
jgi:hypothetical protein